MATCPSCGKELPAGDFPFCPFCTAPLTAAHPARELRKTVTVLFCDVTGSTALGEKLDPESLRLLLARYFERMKAIVEAHGGSVEKFIGDAVMAVFGVPVVHEDDALRAVRAAIEMRDALPEVGVNGRIGIATGEVVTGTEERLATGDAVNTAARLEQAAQPGEILIGAETLRLVRTAVEVEAVEPLALTGKAEPVAAHRLLALADEAPHRHQAPMVGRERERGLLASAWERVTSERGCHLFTVLGPAGVGKSRLAWEFLNSVDDAAIARGRCLPYGEGITYWPVVEIVKQLDVTPQNETAAAAISVLLGEQELVVSGDDIAWAVRKLLEEAASDQPLVVVFDDLHWGEATFLDLVEHVADLARDAPILLLCMARPELLDRRSGWGGGKVNATTVLLEPLPADETEHLIDSLGVVDPSLRARIVEASEGNPLFVEEMLALVDDSASGDVTVPPTIHALLAARLDQLDVTERTVLERGAVEGRVFHRGAVQALAPAGETQLSTRLTALVRKELVRPDKAQLPGEDAYRFRHLLIRDAAYDALPKTARAEMHARFADWLEQRGADLVEIDEIVGYHLEQACRYRVELGIDSDGDLAERARARLTAAGRRATMREDFPAAATFFERAAKLLTDGEADTMLELDLADALFFSGRAADAYRALGAAAVRAAAADDRVGELALRIGEGIYRLYVQPEGAMDQLSALIDAALPELEAARDPVALHEVYFAKSLIAHQRLRWSEVLAARDRAREFAEQTQLPHVIWWTHKGGGGPHAFGATPASGLLAWTDEADASSEQTANRQFRAYALAMLGHGQEASRTMDDVRAELMDRGAPMQLALACGHVAIEIELLAGNPERAVELGEQACRMLEEAGERAWLSTNAAYLGQALYALDRLNEAEAWTDRAAELGAAEDAITQVAYRLVKGKVLARRGEAEEGERLVREALAVILDTDSLNAQADTYTDLGEVLALAGRADEAIAAFEEAATRYAQKENVVMAARTRARIEELSAAETPAA